MRAVRLCLVAFSLLVSICAYAGNPSVAFYYGKNPPVDELRAYNIVVMEPHYGLNPKVYDTQHSKAFAYVSVGEIHKDQSYYSQIPKKWTVGENKHWGTEVVDQANPQWRKFFVDNVIGPLWREGYRGFFLDTLDSYGIAAKTPDEQKAQQNGLVALIKEIKSRYPQAKLILNRGFELLPEVHQDVYAVALESLYSSWKDNYSAVSPEDTKWLMAQVDKIKRYNLPVIVIDYAAPQDRAQARAIAKKIKSIGAIPWVTDKHLASLGVGQVEIMPRKILMFYNNKSTPDIMQSPALTYGAMPLEYLGYVPKIQGIYQSLPQDILPGRVAGIVVWVDSPLRSSKAFSDWLLKQVKAGVPVAFVGNMQFVTQNKPLMDALNLQLTDSNAKAINLTTLSQDPMLGFETPAYPDAASFLPIISHHSQILLALESRKGVKSDAVAITPWGGYAMNPYVISTLPNKQTRWVIDPFKFFKAALHLPNIPIPDTTTENGRRILISHVDGDGFISKSEWDTRMYTGEAMLKAIFDKYQIPITVSFIEGEFEKVQVPMSNRSLINTARDIFARPWVELASHSYSHPYFWDKAEETAHQTHEHEIGAIRLFLPNYYYNLDREITGSVDFINKNLAPHGKKTKVFLWTGNTSPTQKALAKVYEDGLLNMNGGDTIITRDNESLTGVAGLGVYKGRYLQVFAPMQNENIYTNLWRGPFSGFSRVTETFELTDLPRRLKPVDIYYHFYSASKESSLQALDAVYKYALSRPVIPLYSSNYIKKVQDFYHMAIARDEDQWVVVGSGAVKELRLPDLSIFPNLNASKNVIGFNDHGDSRYIHLGENKVTYLTLSDQAPIQPFLLSANAPLDSFYSLNGQVQMSFNGALPLEFDMANSNNCQVRSGGHVLPGKRIGHYNRYNMAQKGSSDVTVMCPV